MSNVRILVAPTHYVLDSAHSGSEFYWAWAYYLKIKDSKGLDAVFVSGGARGITDQNVINMGIFNPAKLDLRFSKLILFYLKSFVVTSRILNSNNIDILHHFLPFRIGWSFNLSFLLGLGSNRVLGPLQAPLSVNDVDLDNNDSRGFSPNKLNIKKIIVFFLFKILNFPFSILSHFTLARADRIVATNNATKKLLLSKGVSEEKIVVIPPGIDINIFKYKPYETKIEKKIELLSTGLLLRRKGLDLVLHAVNKVKANSNYFILRIVGDGPNRPSLEALVDKLGLRDIVIFEGFVEHNEIIRFYQQANIYISGSRAESWGQMYIEAMACGLPVISTENTGSSEIIRDGVTGFLVLQEDVAGLANAIHKLVNDKYLASRMGEAARREVEEKYDWDTVVIPQYVALYKKMYKRKNYFN